MFPNLSSRYDEHLLQLLVAKGATIGGLTASNATLADKCAVLEAEVMPRIPLEPLIPIVPGASPASPVPPIP